LSENFVNDEGKNKQLFGEIELQRSSQGHKKVIDNNKKKEIELQG
jgi:hypothetical protein